MKPNPSLNASHEAAYTDSKFKLYPKPENLDLDDLFRESTSTTNPGWFYYRKLYTFIDSLPPGKVLDLACGAGFLSIYIARAGHSVVAVDISEEAIRYAGELARVYNCSDKIEFHVMDASKLEFPDNSFDLITGDDCLHHILKYNGTLKSIHRVLKPDGIGLFFEPFNFNPFVNVLRKINLITSGRKFEDVLRRKDLSQLRNTFGKVVLSDLSVIYKVPRRFAKFTLRHENFCERLRNADKALQNAFPIIKKFYSAAFIELYKDPNGDVINEHNLKLKCS